MKRYNGGTEAKAGFYWNSREWEITVLQGKGGSLPGDATTRFIRIPMPAMLLVGPIMGAAFVMFLPFIGVAMLGYYGSRKLAAVTGDFVRGAATAMSPAWRPGEAYLAGKPRRAKKGAVKDAASEAKPEAADAITSLEKDVEERRRRD